MDNEKVEAPTTWLLRRLEELGYTDLIKEWHEHNREYQQWRRDEEKRRRERSQHEGKNEQ